MSDLVTGEAVAVELRLARFPSRAMAFAIDVLVLLAIGVPLVVLTGFAIGEADPALASAVILLVVVAVLVGVPVTVETLSRGRSLGKLALGLRVVRDDGGPTRFRHALVRGLAGFFVDFWVTSGAGAVICSLLNSRGKRVGDVLAGTVVVRDRAPASTAAAVPLPPPWVAAWATGTQLAAIPDDLVMSARTYLTRLPQLDGATRDSMGAQLATAVSAYVSPAAPPGTPAWGYLAAVLGERSRREAARLTHDAVPRAASGPLATYGPGPAYPPPAGERPDGHRPTSESPGFTPPS
ncbi:MAG TPA: RDD family protein [Jiangellales bacterium]|nr:RDD family protein [Jiangellales bacterium]